MDISQTAIGTSTVLGIATIGTVIGATAVASTAMKVSLIGLSVLLGAAGIASITAWLDPEATDARSYFQTLKKHTGYSIAFLFQLISQTMIQAVVQGLASGVANSIRRDLFKQDDMTIRVKHV